MKDVLWSLHRASALLKGLDTRCGGNVLDGCFRKEKACVDIIGCVVSSSFGMDVMGYLMLLLFGKENGALKI